MHCPFCQFSNPEGMTFCGGCGRRLELACAACGASFPATFSFYGRCGGRLAPPSSDAPPPSPLGPAPFAPTGAAQRRQLTVMFCDLVGSTALAERLDPEDLREIIHLYQARCAEVMARFGGIVAEFIGDGVVVYFGYPQAAEDAAERSVRAGLALVEAIGRLRPHAAGVRLLVRIGIATGLVVVGEPGGADAARGREVVGTTPNLAARLQKLAPPNGVVIGPRTRELAGGLFRYVDLGEHRLEGFSEPVRVFQVTGEGAAADRFEARTGHALTPMVDRRREAALLLDRWRRARRGEGQVVLLSGEPGIGKSRIVRALRERLKGEPHAYLLHCCSPLYQHSTLHPIIERLQRAAGIERDDGPERRSAKLETLLADLTVNRDRILPVVAELLSVAEGDARRPGPDPGPERRKEETLEALLALLEGHAARQPVLAAFEDVQWVDPTTREFLELAIDRVRGLPVLMIVTFRTGFSLFGTGGDHLVTLVLGRLERGHCATVVDRVARNKALPKEVRDQIVARTDGVPLFLEEMTKAVLESQLLREEGGRYVLAEERERAAIPAMLRDSLVARLDRHASAKAVAQIAACIGREFSHDLLAMVAPLPGAELQEALDQLVASALIFERGARPRATYTFKHALVQDIAYESLLRGRRRLIHRQIASTLDRFFPDTAPELLAHHCAQAGMVEEAVRHYERAGERARERSANAEAVAHFGKALEQIERLPESPARTQHELALRIAYGAQLISTRGNAAPEVEAAYSRARLLSEQVGETPLLFRALRGLQTFYIVRGRLTSARHIGERLLAQAERAGDPDTLLQAHRPHGLCLLYSGDFGAARGHLERALALYDPERHRHHRFEYGSDPGVLARCNMAWVEWFLGYPNRALEHSRAALAMADALGHAHSQAFALSLTASLHQFRSDAVEAQACGEAVIELARDHRFAYWESWGRAVRGWALSAQGGGANGLRELEEGLEAYRATGAELMRPYFSALLAESLGRLGRSADGLRLVDEALAMAESHGIRFYEAELHRLRAELVAGVPAAPEQARIASLRRALAVARGQRARSLELRAALTLARALRGSTEHARALAELRAIQASFTEGLDSAAMLEAQSLLA